MYSYILLVLLFITFIIRFNIIKESKYNIKETNFIVQVKNIKKNNDGYTIYLKGKEDLITYTNTYFNIGEKLYLEGTLELPKENNIPNNFNYKKYLNNSNIFYILNINKINKSELSTNIFYKLKNRIINIILNQNNYSYLMSFILGNTSYLNQNIRNRISLLGISHLFSLSGMHVSLIVLILDKLFKKIIKNDKLIFIIINLFFIVYLFLVNYQISIIRSYLCYLVFKLNEIYKLKYNSNLLFILITLISLNINPKYIYSTSFQYSYIITFTLIRYSKLIKGNYIKKIFIVSLLSTLVSLPITIYNNFEFNLLSPFFNIIFVPMVSFILFPLAFFQLIVCIFWPLYKVTILLFELLVDKLSSINSIIIFPKPSIIIIILYYILLVIILELKRRNKSIKKEILLFSLFLIIWKNINLNTNNLVVFNVNQGDSILLKNRNNITLIDIAANYQKTYEEEITNYIKSLGFNKINNLVLTHGDNDHSGSVINLLDTIKIDKVYFNNNSYNNLELEIIKKLEEKSIYYQKLDTEIKLSTTTLLNLNNIESNDENTTSLVLYTVLNNKKILLMGDADIEAENNFLNQYDIDNIDCFKVGHHGANTSSSKEFINKINPKISIISVGKNNRYGHPKDEVLKTLKNSKIYRTDIDGTIEIKLNKNGYKIRTCPP